ncbi:hypothetical protein CDO73_18085 [Saccharibacillus sp. O23]|uniref:MFS transporter n=1 Tax=Saccharibacillus sp. O23 TaxID=2009338 RepID=UPI000B4E2731|nr:MFS transporter [Saccharibacillus sp. O23]OWR28462.1 hypothetical protein CDO73_18085 [Saccharibacillus sp. O23]
MSANSDIPARSGKALLRILVFTLILSVMNGSMFNVALPTISEDFRLSPAQVSWIVTGYLIVYAVGAVMFGKLTEKYAPKNLLTFGLLVLSAGSVLGLVSSTYGMIIVARICQAVGASVIPALAMIIPIRYFAPEQRGRALGTTSVGIALGTALGPIIAGFVTAFLNWKMLFVIPLLSLITIPFYRKHLLGEPAEPDRQIDFPGGVLLAGTVASLLLALTDKQLGYAGISVALLILFVWRIRRAAEPFISPSLFRNRLYSANLTAAFLIMAISLGLPFLLPQLLSQVYGFSPAAIGLVMLPSALVTALLGRTGGRLADDKGHAFLLYAASALLIAGFVGLSSAAGHSSLLVAFFLIFGVLGQSYMQIALSAAVSRTLEPGQVGVGMGLLSMSNFIAAASATAVLGSMLGSDRPAVKLNPFSLGGESAMYSNILIVLAIAALAFALLYRASSIRRMRASNRPTD